MGKGFVSPRWKNPLCWGSLLLNVVLIGFILLGPHGPSTGRPLPQDVFTKMAEDLEGQDRIIYEAVLQKHMDNMKKSGRNIHEALGLIGQAAHQEPFDLDNVKAAHTHLHAQHREMDKAITDFVYEMLVSLSPEGRQKLRFAPPKRD
ncbi:hypothetical protein MTBPR1_60110 [Candidatus Terasakiella magnetica]|uniref:Uncharacterized protein n=1 Tax=Candidatus Terasakiella magnetica TaxID=1867952 RepID=A0A1C3RK38_9PROT|nr:periplasmic heavy metal sensor [Candidatus Terasakiella magnetica]SCA57597.1 hypothetical protein MTBPR1_60110 [Candidatus Terasakiella magnetica]